MKQNWNRGHAATENIAYAHIALKTCNSRQLNAGIVEAIYQERTRIYEHPFD
jgi:hypothetical protein